MQTSSVEAWPRASIESKWKVSELFVYKDSENEIASLSCQASETCCGEVHLQSFNSASGFARLLEANTHHVNPQSVVHVRPFTEITLQCPAVHGPTNLVVSIVTHHGPYSSRYLDMGDIVLTIALMSLAIGPTAVVVHGNGSQLWDTFLVNICIATDHDTKSQCRRPGLYVD